MFWQVDCSAGTGVDHARDQTYRPQGEPAVKTVLELFGGGLIGMILGGLLGGAPFGGYGAIIGGVIGGAVGTGFMILVITSKDKEVD